MSAVLRIARGAAIAIAIAAVVDPAVTTRRASKPQVAVVSSSADSTSVHNVERQLRRDYSVIHGEFALAAATVVVGGPAKRGASGPLFVVNEERSVTIEHVEAPAEISIHGASSIRASVRLRGARGRNVAVTLGVPGAALIDTKSFVAATNDATQSVALDVAPHDVGAQVLRITARAGADSASADFVVDVTDRKSPVLFYDAAPSWGATFVRRAAENDVRFDVHSRTNVSRSISSRAGAAPQSLAQSGALDRYDAIVVSSPSVLTAADVQGLDDYMRTRGGAVFLMVDQRADGPWQRLITGTQLRSINDTRLHAIHASANDTTLLASDIITPAALPVGARVIAATSGNDPVVWEMPHGAGRLIVGGAADAWHFRDTARSAFNAFWTGAIAAAAQSTRPDVFIQTDGVIHAPHDVAYITVITRTNAGSTPNATLDAAGSSHPIRLWPSDRAGIWRGAFRVPAYPGTYRVNVSGDVGRASAPVVVSIGASRAAPEAHDVLAALAVSRGGTVVASSRIADLPREIGRRIHPPAVRVRWHPMRSAWWIVPFALLLSAEWYWRRRRGLL